MSNGLYVYAFVDRACAVEDLVGIGQAPVALIGSGPPFALASEHSGARLRPDRRSLGAHQRVLSAISDRAAVLPTTFGVVADSAAELRDLIERHADDITVGLGRVSGCVEMSLRVQLDVPNVFEHLVGQDDELRALRDELVRRGDGASHQLRVDTGRRVERVLNALRDEHARVVEEALAEPCRELAPGPAGGECDLCSVACLVERDALGRFDAAVESLGEALPDEVLISLGGPFAPHSFVDLHLAAQSA